MCNLQAKGFGEGSQLHNLAGLNTIVRAAAVVTTRFRLETVKCFIPTWRFRLLTGNVNCGTV